MSQVIGFIVLAALAALLCKWLIEEIRRTRIELAVDRIEGIAYREYRANRPIDRVGLMYDLIGAPGPLNVVIQAPPATPDELERLEKKRLETLRAIGSVRIASAMTPCDEVTRPHFFTDRDFGDETPAF